MEPITHSLVAAGGIAAVIRTVVPILRSKLAGFIWDKGPRWIKPMVLIGLAGGLALCDSLAMGPPWDHSVLAALAALGAATTTYEAQKSLKGRNGKAE